MTRARPRAAGEHGVAAAAIRRANHVGRLGEWVELLADEGLVALAFCNAEPTVAPFGGRERRLGTNPIAWAAPRRPPAPPLVMDWSTATMPEGKLAVARARGEQVPDGVLVDAEGEPSHDPADFYAGGALLPLGAHKGSGLSVMIQLVGGALAGTGVVRRAGRRPPTALVLIALDLAAFAAATTSRTRPRRSAPRWPPPSRPAASTPSWSRARSNDARARTARTRGSRIPAATWSELEALKGGARA